MLDGRQTQSSGSSRSIQIVTIYMDSDEPWFEYELLGADGEIEYHSIKILDDESWKRM
jgi:hypothetical protein